MTTRGATKIDGTCSEGHVGRLTIRNSKPDLTLCVECETLARKARSVVGYVRQRKPKPRIPCEDRFFSKVEPTGFCWYWVGAHCLGYGRFRALNPATGQATHQVLAHRWSYEYLVGPIPEGLEIDHLCRNPLCVNPDHLEPVTRKENNLRSYNVGGVNARKTHCPQGHEYTEENTYVETMYYGGKGRKCRECGRIKGRKDYWAKKNKTK